MIRFKPERSGSSSATILISSSGGPAGDLVFDHAWIHARAAELDLGPEVFARQTGLSLGELARLGPTRVSVAQLAHIAAVLDLLLEDLLTTTPPPAGTDRSPQVSGCRRSTDAGIPAPG